MKILFVLQSIGYGGSMTSLINLLTLLKKEDNIKCDVLLMDPYGELYDEVKKVADKCIFNKAIESVTLSRKKIVHLKKFNLYIYRILFYFLGKLTRNSTEICAYNFEKNTYKNKYDCIIAYQESVATNFVSLLDNEKKITWVHNDYKNVVNLYSSKEKFKSTYSKFDKIVCVSKAGSENFKKFSGLDKNRITYLYNTLLKKVIEEKSNEQIINIIKNDLLIKKMNDKSIMKFVSSGRHVEQKRFDRVINISEKLKDSGYNFVWVILGDGILYERYKKLVDEKGLNNYVFLVGAVKNPFPIIKSCDFFVLTSDFEAHPMVANEALILHKPVISTNFESAVEVIKNNENGAICSMNEESIYEVIKNLFDSPEYLEKLKNGAINFNYSNDMIISRFLSLVKSL